MTERNERRDGPANAEEGERYDPYLHRETVKPVSDIGSMANLVKSAAGTGLFAMPNAFACVGLLVGVIGTLLMGLLVGVSMRILLGIHQAMCRRSRRPALTYDEVVVAALTAGDPKARVSQELATFVVDVAMLTCYIGIGSVYVVFIAGIVEECLDPNRVIGQSNYCLMLFPIFLLMNMTRHLREIAPLSHAGNFLLLIAVGIGVIYALKDGIGDTWRMVGPNVELYPKFIGMVYFAMVSPGVVLAIEHSMKNPWNYGKCCGVFDRGMLFLVLLHTGVGAVGYLKWGNDALGNFIRNHLQNDWATVLALMAQALALYFTYGLQCYMPIRILLNDYAMPAIEQGVCAGSPFFWDLTIRAGVSFLTCILAAAIPKLDLFIGLVGAVSMSTLATFIPAVLYLLLNYSNAGRLKWKLVFGAIVLFVGCFATFCAIVTYLTLIVKYIKHGNGKTS